MKISSIIAAALTAAGKSIVDSTFGKIRKLANFKIENYRQSRNRTNSSQSKKYDGCPQSEKDDGLPRGYSGAKLARKAMLKQVAVKHPRGLRLDGVTI